MLSDFGHALCDRFYGTCHKAFGVRALCEYVFYKVELLRVCVFKMIYDWHLSKFTFTSFENNTNGNILSLGAVMMQVSTNVPTNLSKNVSNKFIQNLNRPI